VLTRMRSRLEAAWTCGREAVTSGRGARAECAALPPPRCRSAHCRAPYKGRKGSSTGSGRQHRGRLAAQKWYEEERVWHSDTGLHLSPDEGVGPGLCRVRGDVHEVVAVPLDAVLLAHVQRILDGRGHVRDVPRVHQEGPPPQGTAPRPQTATHPWEAVTFRVTIIHKTINYSHSQSQGPSQAQSPSLSELLSVTVRVTTSHSHSHSHCNSYNL